jgi:divalent metal cation (Fe/Co/Zn/Cd) transporter
LLVGESASSERIRDMCNLAESDPDVVGVATPFTMQLGPEDVLVNLEVTFSPELTADRLLAAIDRLDQRIREKFPVVKHLFIEAQRLRRSP